jgi:hypothetical protein
VGVSHPADIRQGPFDRFAAATRHRLSAWDANRATIAVRFLRRNRQFLSRDSLQHIGESLGPADMRAVSAG